MARYVSLLRYGPGFKFWGVDWRGARRQGAPRRRTVFFGDLDPTGERARRLWERALRLIGHWYEAEYRQRHGGH